jgi:transcriptional regulator with XRE-family HTH domain
MPVSDLERQLRAEHGERIRSRRTALGLTQVQLAQRMSLGQDWVSSVELGLTGIRDDTRIRLANALDCDVLDLFVVSTQRAAS